MQESLDDTHIEIVQEDEYSSPEHMTEQSLLYEQIQHATNNLSSKEKSVFVLRQFQDQKLEDIANILNINPPDHASGPRTVPCLQPGYLV